MNASEVLAAHAVECTGPGEVSCRCRIVRWMSWSEYYQHQDDMLAAAGLLVPSGMCVATCARCGAPMLTSSADPKNDAMECCPRCADAVAVEVTIRKSAEHDREVAERAWDEGVEAVGDAWADDRPFANPYRATSIAISDAARATVSDETGPVGQMGAGDGERGAEA